MKPFGRIAELDGVRGLAIALVLVWHYLASSIDQRVAADGLVVLSKVFALTWSGVDLFFVLSGFLIGGILLDNIDSPTYFRTFYVRRIARILPLYFAWFLLFLIIVRLGIFRSIPSLEHLFADPLPVWSYVTFTQNFVMTSSYRFGAEWLGVTWSLAIEEQFYLILPYFEKGIVRWGHSFQYQEARVVNR